MGIFKTLDIDLDDVFAYKTSRRVVMRDRKLGIARVLIVVALFIYVVVYEVIMQKGYLIKDEPVGFATLSVRRNEWSDNDVHCCPAEGCGGACNGADARCSAQASQLNCISIPSCGWVENEGLSAFGSNRGKLECVTWDRHNLLRPPTEEYSLLITTRVRVSVYQELPIHCRLNRSSNPCAPWEEQSETTFYTTGVEDMTIMIDHGVYGRESKTIVMSQDMDRGVFSDGNGNAFLSFCGGDPLGFASPNVDTSCTAEDRNRPGDIFTVQQLLKSAGIDTLNSRVEDGEDTRRYDGVAVLVVVSYDGSGIDTELQYTYRTFELPGVEYMYEEVLYEEPVPGVTRRSVWKRHGVRMVVVPAGFVAIFSFAELMKTLMIATGLFSAAKFFVEYILIRLLPYSSVYKRYRDVKTIDFSDFTKEELNQLRDVHFAYGEVREGGTIDPVTEQEIGDKLDERVEEFKRENPLPPPPITATPTFNQKPLLDPYGNPPTPPPYASPVGNGYAGYGGYSPPKQLSI